MKRAIAVGAISVATLGACGGSVKSAAPPRSSRTTTTGATGSSSTTRPTTTGAGSENANPKVRAKVLELRNALDVKYAAEEEELKTAGLLSAQKDPDEQRIDESIQGACAAEARGFRASEEQTAYTITYMAGPLSRHGHDPAGFLSDIQERDRKIADLMDCP